MLRRWSHAGGFEPPTLSPCDPNFQKDIAGKGLDWIEEGLTTGPSLYRPYANLYPSFLGRNQTYYNQLAYL